LSCIFNPARRAEPGAVKKQLAYMSSKGDANPSTATLATLYSPLFLPTSTTTDLIDGKSIAMTDPAVFDYPLLYMEHAGYMRLSEDEVAALRKYLLGGGALLVNDFWGIDEWNGLAAQIKRVLPNKVWTELTTDHPVFNCVYDLRKPMS